MRRLLCWMSEHRWIALREPCAVRTQVGVGVLPEQEAHVKLTASALKYERVGADGYSEAAVKHLRHAAQAFLRALDEMEAS